MRAPLAPPRPGRKARALRPPESAGRRLSGKIQFGPGARKFVVMHNAKPRRRQAAMFTQCSRSPQLGASTKQSNERPGRFAQLLTLRPGARVARRDQRPARLPTCRAIMFARPPPAQFAGHSHQLAPCRLSHFCRHRRPSQPVYLVQLVRVINSAEPLRAPAAARRPHALKWASKVARQRLGAKAARLLQANGPHLLAPLSRTKIGARQPPSQPATHPASRRGPKLDSARAQKR